ncbi:hypothetical protein [Acinetobacter sp. ANC 4648]|uniref:hypothetical protein n=1 Tax=Acinetobacter sp. ANC 4648 TaxID=1977875 RepID=UPI000A343A19|nr:hypothetical protein [Acinetobacter sp. ANC 4648]OTG81515.1 hypothetical protein B9T27_09515 [Acinetobacter sp. ANC 4648]
MSQAPFLQALKKPHISVRLQPLSFALIKVCLLLVLNNATVLAKNDIYVKFKKNLNAFLTLSAQEKKTYNRTKQYYRNKQISI